MGKVIALNISIMKDMKSKLRVGKDASYRANLTWSIFFVSKVLEYSPSCHLYYPRLLSLHNGRVDSWSWSLCDPVHWRLAVNLWLIRHQIASVAKWLCGRVDSGLSLWYSLTAAFFLLSFSKFTQKKNNFLRTEAEVFLALASCRVDGCFRHQKNLCLERK